VLFLEVAIPTGAAAQTITLVNLPGLDSCTAPTTSQMTAFWRYTPYWFWAIYIGGATRLCAQPNLSSSWVQAVTTEGWRLLPTWAGPQAPCNCGSISWSTQTAYSQGRNEAMSAYEAILGLGMSSDAPIADDVEAFNTSNGSCVSAVQSYVLGWRDQLAVPPAQTSGIYGSSCASDLNAYRYPRYPDFIWGAYWDGNSNVYDMACVSSGNWIHHQRFKQYNGPGHYETWNGVTLYVDNDEADGPAYY